MNPLRERELHADPPPILRPRRQRHRNRRPGLALCAPAAHSPPRALPGFPNFAPKAKRVIYLHQSGAPSQMDLFDPKPKLAERFGEELPDSIRQGQRLTGMTSEQKKFPGRAVQVQVRAARQGRHVAQRTAAAHREDRRRHLRRQEPLHRGHQPRPGHHVHPDRQPGRRPAVLRLVGLLRPRQREPGPARVRRHDLARHRPPRRSAALRPPLGQRLSAHRSIRASSSAPAATPCSTSRTRPASTPRVRRSHARRHRRAQRGQPARSSAIPRSPTRIAAVRDGVSHADLRARS